MVLRAFAVHPEYRKSEAAQAAARLLASRFFQPDRYTSYQAASYWVRFEYPFWWNNLVAALDSVSLIGLTRDDEQIRKALDWLVDHQEEDGSVEGVLRQARCAGEGHGQGAGDEAVGEPGDMPGAQEVVLTEVHRRVSLRSTHPTMLPCPPSVALRGMTGLRRECQGAAGCCRELRVSLMSSLSIPPRVGAQGVE